MRWLVMLLLALDVAISHAAPVPDEPRDEPIRDHAGFLPQRRFTPLEGKVVGIVLPDPAPILAREGRAGPADQRCFSVGGSSYRWMYVGGNAKPTIGTLRMPLPGERERAFDGLSMANAETLQRWKVPDRPCLVEVEINGGDGSAAFEAFVITQLTVIDGTERFPPKLVDILAETTKRYDAYLSEQAKSHDAKLVELARQHLKGEAATGPRERTTWMYVTWLPESSRVQVRYLTRITDGAYRYAQGIRIETGPAPIPVGPPGGGEKVAPRLPLGGRYGMQIGVESGMLLEVGKSGKIERQRPLTLDSFQQNLPEPPLRRRR